MLWWGGGGGGGAKQEGRGRSPHACLDEFLHMLEREDYFLKDEQKWKDIYIVHSPAPPKYYGKGLHR